MRLQTVQIDSFDPDAMDETVTGASFSHIPLAPGRFRADLLTAISGKQILNYGSYNLALHAQGTMPESHLTLGFVLVNREATSLNGFHLDGPALVVMREGSTLDYRLAPGTEWLAFQVTGESLERLGIDPAKLPKTPIGHRSPLSGRLGRELQGAILALQELGAPPPTIAAPESFGKTIFASVMDALQAALQGDGRGGTEARRYHAADYRLVRQALDYIDANITETLQIGMLCSELETNWRSLERAFTRLLGVTPKRYVQLARLARARRLLMQSRQAGLSVGEIAISCGIGHLGRFSQVYRDVFGELPSETLSR